MADLSSKCFSSYARIFCAILNNLARVIYVINANGTLCISLVPSIGRWERWFLSKARCLSSANEWILDLFSSFIAELTILLHLLGLYASPIELKLLCREKFTRAFKSIYAGVFSPLYYPWGKRGLTHSWKRNPLSKRVFCAQWNTRKAWWERIYRILGQFQVRFFIQIQIVDFRNQFCVRLCNNPQMKFESKEDSLRMDPWIKSKCGLLRFWFVRFFGHGRILEVYLRSGFNVRK